MTADEMFKELGYVRTIIFNNTTVYENINGDITISFYSNKSVEKSTKCYDVGLPITMQELKAINKKVEELGWNE